MDSANTIAIIGAGIGGLAAALALLRQGLDVDVYEQSPELGEIGAGIQISANGTRVLYALGLETALHGIEVLPSRRQIRHWSTGETWDWFELGAVTRFLPTGETELLLGIWLRQLASKWRFTPALSGGRPVSCWMALDATLDYTIDSAKKKSERVVKKNLRAAAR